MGECHTLCLCMWLKSFFLSGTWKDSVAACDLLALASDLSVIKTGGEKKVKNQSKL